VLVTEQRAVECKDDQCVYSHCRSDHHAAAAVVRVEKAEDGEM